MRPAARRMSWSRESVRGSVMYAPCRAHGPPARCRRFSYTAAQAVPQWTRYERRELNLRHARHKLNSTRGWAAESKVGSRLDLWSSTPTTFGWTCPVSSLGTTRGSRSTGTSSRSIRLDSKARTAQLAPMPERKLMFGGLP
jgi:hypothetical protein